MDGILARYYAERRAYIAGGAVISVMLALLVLVLFAKLDREKRAERELRESEARYRALSDLSADSYWEQDERYRFTMILPGQSFKSVVQHQSMLGKTRWELPHTAMTDEDWRAHREGLDRHEKFRDLLLKGGEAEGRLVFINVRGDPLLGSWGGVKGDRGPAKEK